MRSYLKEIYIFALVGLSGVAVASSFPENSPRKTFLLTYLFLFSVTPSHSRVLILSFSVFDFDYSSFFFSSRTIYQKSFGIFLSLSLSLSIYLSLSLYVSLSHTFLSISLYFVNACLL
jgi:hypothetical protein